MSRERVFISGSLVNLREAASTKATVVKQVPIGTGCVVEEKADSGWWRIGCGDSQGWTKAELLSAERPTLEPLLALAEDSKHPLKDRFDAMLRATALEPEHAGARDLLWSLFAEQEWVQLESLLTQETGRRPQLHVSVTCEGASSTEACLEGAFRRSPYSAARSSYRRLELHDSERLGRSLFVRAVLEIPFEKTKPPQLWVRTGTVEGDSKKLDIQIFAESRYVPSESLKIALEKLPETNVEYESVSKVDAVLSPEEQEAVQQLAGTWTQLHRQPQGLVLSYDCLGIVGMQVHIKMSGNQVGVRVETQDWLDFDVGGVQFAKDGSITLRMLNGATLKHTLSRDDKRMSRLTGVSGDGLFLHSAQKGEFPTVGPAPGECEDL